MPQGHACNEMALHCWSFAQRPAPVNGRCDDTNVCGNGRITEMHKCFGAKSHAAVALALLAWAALLVASPAFAAGQTPANKAFSGLRTQTFPTVGTCRAYCARRYEGARASIC